MAENVDESLEQFASEEIKPRDYGDRPTLKDLVTHVIPLVNTKWFDIGVQLLDPKYENELNTIEADTKHDAATCCRKMFCKWLNSDGLANWKKLMKALRMVQMHYVADDIEKLLLQGAPQVPVITSHPQNFTILKGYQVILEVKACGTMPLCYQWYYEHDIVPGENKSFYKIYPVTIRNAGHYFCQVKNHYGVVYSSIAMVVVESFTTEISSEKSTNFKKLPMSEMQESTDLASKNESTMTDGSSEDIDVAFSTFVDKMYDALSKEDFKKVRRKCLENLHVVGGISLPVDTEKKIMVTRNLADLFDVCCHCRPYWNWMNIRILEKMASNSSAARKLIEGYKKEIFSRKVKDVISEISDLEIPTDKYIEVKEKWNKNFDDLLIQDIVQRWRDIEKKLNVKETMLLKSITAGCVEVCWLLHNDLVEHAIFSATNNHTVRDDDQSLAQKPVKEDDHSDIGQSFIDGDYLTAQEPFKKDDQSTTQGSVKGSNQSPTNDLFPEVSYLKIGDVVIKDDITNAIVHQAANHLRQNYIKSRFYYTPNDWPPYHPKHYTTLAFIHRKGKCVNTEVISVTQELVTKGNLSKSHPFSGNISYHSKDISELFPTNLISSYFLLIEGAPGIGKTVLCKEIAYQWAENKILKSKNLVFLLFLQDPIIKQLMSLESLSQYLFDSTKIAFDLLNYFIQSKGKGLVFIFDGYDEMSEEDRNNSLVAKIISRNMLPECDLVITSRPSTSLYLRDVADCRVEVLGFTEEDRLDYIQQTLKGSDDKIEALQFYLQSNSTINALCYVPLNMTILLCLFKDIECISHGALNLGGKKDIRLLNTQTEMYEKFILMTIARFIKKSDKILRKFLTFSDLPEPYYKAFNELSYLAYYALTKDQIVFSFNDEIIQGCPVLKSGNCEGLGLLNVTEYVNNVSFHFLHFSVQEYLAAYYIASQSDNFQVKLLNDTFWDIHYFNTWIMYVGMTGGKKIAWKHFISGNRFMISTKMFRSSRISKRYLNDKIKSLHLFQCFAEIGDKGKVFVDKIIDLSNQTLIPRDINIICFFLLRSVNKHWIKLDLSNCNIRDIGSDILRNTFLDKSRDIVGIDKVDLSYNQLQSHSILGLLDVFKVWHASEVVIYGSHDNDSSLFESCLNKFSLYNEDFSQAVLIGPYIFANNVDIHNQIINSTNIITGLYLDHYNHPSTSIKYEELSDKLKLSKLHVIGENIRCYFIVALVQTIKEVDSVYIYDHTLSDEDVNYISSMLSKINSNNLIGVWVVIGRTKIQGNIPDMFTLNKHFSPIEICNLGDEIKRLCSSSTMSTAKFSKYIRFESKSVFEDFFYLLHEMNSKCEINFCLLENNLLIANGVEYGRFHKIIPSSENLISVYITKCKLNVPELTDLIGKQKSLEKLYIFDSFLDIQSFEYEHLLNQTLRLKELFIHNTNPSCTLTFDLLEAKKYYQNISVLLIMDNILIGHNPTFEQILLSSKLKEHCIMTLSALKLSNFHVINEAADELATILFCNSLLRELDLSYNNLSASDAVKIFSGMKNISHLMTLNISHNMITDEAAEIIATVLSHNNKLQSLNLSYNYFTSEGFINIFEHLKSIVYLRNLNISHNEITDKAAHSIATFLSLNLKVEELDLSNTILQTPSTIIIFKSLRYFSNLKKLYINGIMITDAAADDIAAVLLQNTKLEELDVSCNHLQALGAMIICRASLMNLTTLNISHNGITAKAANDIAAFLSRNTKLEKLDLSHNHLLSAGIITICKIKLTKLTTLDISHNSITVEATKDIAAFLSHNTKLQFLDLSCNNLQESGCVSILKVLQHTSVLSSLKVSDCNVTGEAADELATVLLHNTELEDLDLHNNELLSDGIIRICLTMKNILNLKRIDISRNRLTGEAADDIANVLSQNANLQELYLSDNYLQSHGIVMLFNRMSTVSKLTHLDISSNEITDEAADEIGDFLLHNSNLRVLDLSNNLIQAAGARIIFGKGSTNYSLKKLNLSLNAIDDEAADIMATFISKNPLLEEFDLSNNYIQAVGAVNIFKAIQNCPNICKVNMSHNRISDEAGDEIAYVLSKVTKLREVDLGFNLLSAEMSHYIKSYYPNMN